MSSGTSPTLGYARTLATWLTCGCDRVDRALETRPEQVDQDRVPDAARLAAGADDGHRTGGRAAAPIERASERCSRDCITASEAAVGSIGKTKWTASCS